LRTLNRMHSKALERSRLGKKIVPYLARHTYGTYTMAKTRNTFAVADSMGHVDLKLMEPYRHQELEPLRAAIKERNQGKKERRYQQTPAGLNRSHISGHTSQTAD